MNETGGRLRASQPEKRRPGPGRNFSGVENDLRGHPGKMTRRENGNFDPGATQFETNSKT